jgi:sterol desaturase/sphingolipid hydroxylase (fatty acid hydroxylase superfamily)
MDASQLEQACEHEADGPLPRYEDVVAGQQIEAVDGFEDGVHGLEHGAFLKGVFGGDFHDAAQDEGHHADVFGKAAAGGFEASRDAGALVLRALGEGAVAAVMAIHARDVVMESDAIAEVENRGSGVGGRGGALKRAATAADLHDGTGGFVAEDTRGRDGAVLDFLYISWADTAGGDFDEEFVAANARDGDSFGAEVVGAVVNGGAHHLWYFKHAFMLAMAGSVVSCQLRAIAARRRSGLSAEVFVLKMGHYMQQFVHRWINALEYGAISFIGAALAFAVLERIFSFDGSRKPWRATFLDLQYFFVGQLCAPAVSFGIAGVFAYFAIHRIGPMVKPSPVVFWLKLLAVLFACDIWAYVRHRFFHSKFLWAFHSIHHSSEQVTWTSGPRIHIIESVADVTGETIIFTIAALIGVGPKILFFAGIIIGVWNFLIHSNTRWTFGPFRYVIVSPVQHRWHHSDSAEAMDKNFAVMFSCIDVALGTFYMPKDRFPKTTGLMGEERKNHPRTFLGQLLYPFGR